MEVLTKILIIALPFIEKLIESTVVPFIKRTAYQKLDNRVDNLILDLAQNASKIANEENADKKWAYQQGTKLGIDTIRAIAEKLNKAADEIEKAL